ncbi:cyclopropane-fatty-acyl-phospholipid synthase family protein [Sphingomonas sp. NSE70-1]|uniref:Cyclopropane-fatty-acyl-phospholipid synthase family protein n=1 Tax=Sphingomonas caseinilyticus TaxID=2908205 RepID=A0ABT0RXB1_9SPHN|nr:cyclopropane-fatty-acyl-phospholipid synthase family protein [Sphingomonas caseinilyticus]MCL6699664.1 cyclopropane-fatty-acyl-phospholipid synthase family protein [Sphingomonas caseinilyticus]
MATRGEHLIHADRGFATGAGIIGSIAAPAFKRVLDHLHERLETGGIEASLPDGSERRIGFHRPGPVAIVAVHSWIALVRLVTSGSVGWYRAWAAGEWSSPDPVPLFELFMRNGRSLGEIARAKGARRWINALAHRLRDNRIGQAKENIAAHYDLGNDFYAEWLDPSMTYSSARFAAGDTLERAQLRKIRMLLDRLNLKPGDRLLEIGSGWGTLAIEAAKRGVRVVGLTLSAEQKSWAEEKIAASELSDLIEIRLQDYREIREQFDAVASVEMVEAVGERWWPAYLDCIASNLKPCGRAALQFISIRHELFDSYSRNADFIQAYIFPGGMLIDEPRFRTLAKERGLGWEDRDGFGLDYAETLQQWRERYDMAVLEGRLSGFSDLFHNLWRYYLMYCEGGFRGAGIDVAQVTMAKA